LDLSQLAGTDVKELQPSCAFFNLTTLSVRLSQLT